MSDDTRSSKQALRLTFEPDRDNKYKASELYEHCIAGSLVDQNGWIIARVWADCDDPQAKAQAIVDAVNRAADEPEAPLTPHGQALLDEAASLIRQIGRELDWGPGVKGETWARINAFTKATAPSEGASHENR